MRRDCSCTEGETVSATNPLFIPLNSEHYEAFKAGWKHTEYRLYGARWNERSCVVGRGVTLSKGYGKKDRLTGKVSFFRSARLREVHGGLNRIAIGLCYPSATENTLIACITVEIEHAEN
jgi:hypothetical protein